MIVVEFVKDVLFKLGVFSVVSQISGMVPGTLQITIGTHIRDDSQCAHQYL